MGLLIPGFLLTIAGLLGIASVDGPVPVIMLFYWILAMFTGVACILSHIYMTNRRNK